MSLRLQTSNARTLALFAPLALSVLVLMATLYFVTHQGTEPRSSLQQSLVRPQPSPAAESPLGLLPPDTDFARHVAELKKRLPANEFTIIIQTPFVVIGDGTPSAVRSQAETVGWAVEKLKREYFEKDPAQILDIWLFKDGASYMKHARQFFNDVPNTPYGYYSSAHRALVMNIQTGGGTLVHEIVHPFVEANFPDCPPWFNEGLGSLYEQSGEREGHIIGFTNWRLPGLQRAIRARAVPSFKALMALDTNAFYNDDKGTNYGQSRYLLYYLQEKGLLSKFYKEFYARRRGDPTGYKTLQAVLGESDLEAFKERWEKFVLALSQEFELRVLAN